MVKGSIDYSKIKYSEKKFGGRKKKIDDQVIYEMARNGKTSTEIAECLEVSKSAIDHSDGWRRRKEQDFVF